MYSKKYFKYKKKYLKYKNKYLRYLELYAGSVTPDHTNIKETNESDYRVIDPNTHVTLFLDVTLTKDILEYIDTRSVLNFYNLNVDDEEKLEQLCDEGNIHNGAIQYYPGTNTYKINFNIYENVDGTKTKLTTTKKSRAFIMKHDLCGFTSCMNDLLAENHFNAVNLEPGTGVNIDKITIKKGEGRTNLNWQFFKGLLTEAYNHYKYNIDKWFQKPHTNPHVTPTNKIFASNIFYPYQLKWMANMREKGEREPFDFLHIAIPINTRTNIRYSPDSRSRQQNSGLRATAPTFVPNSGLRAAAPTFVQNF